MRSLFVSLILGIAAFAPAETTYLGLYMQGSKIGYSSYDTADATVDGVAATRSDSTTVMSTNLLGTSLQMRIDSTTWTVPGGRPLRMKFDVSSAGRTQKLNAVFRDKDVAIDIDNSGNTSKTVLPLPKDGAITDDPLNIVMADKLAVGATRSFWVLDPLTVSFIKTDVKVSGKTKVKVGTDTVDANLVQVIDPRATMQVFLSDKGDLIKVDSGIGIEMRPVSKEVALGRTETMAVAPDIAEITKIRPSRPISNPRNVTDLTIRVSNKDLSRIPSDDHQTKTKEGDAWKLVVHPAVMTPGATIKAAATQKPEWLKPSLNIPAAAPRFKSLASEIVSGKKDVRSAARAVHDYVHRIMRPDAGIGVLRDANEVLDSKVGVCRDYAILTTTLLRAAGMPARLASGMVYADGAFYYHAWAEVWDSKHWVGVDSTLPEERLSAVHVKLGDGNVDTAFAFSFLANAKIDVLNAKGS